MGSELAPKPEVVAWVVTRRPYVREPLTLVYRVEDTDMSSQLRIWNGHLVEDPKNAATLCGQAVHYLQRRTLRSYLFINQVRCDACRKAHAHATFSNVRGAGDQT